MYSKTLTKKQRKKVYKDALKYYRENAKNKFINNRVYGMCRSIYHVASFLDQYDTRSYVNENNFPEFFSFKPKSTWKKDPDYWFSYYDNEGGYDKRVSILAALAAGKTPEQWKKEWEETGKK